MITLIVPAYTSGPNLKRTIDSCSEVCDETVVVSTVLYDDDILDIKSIASKVVELPWNYVFMHGFGSLYNAGSTASKNDWLMLLGVAETFAQPYFNTVEKVSHSDKRNVFRCDHVNDSNQWKRVWNRNGGTMWSGLIHEEIIGGEDGGLLFRMQDTDKVPDADCLKREAFRLLKACSYHWQYHKLRENPSLLGGTNPGWLDFVKGSTEANVSFLSSHEDLMECCLNGDRNGFLSCVEDRVLKGVGAIGCP